ncbi:S-methyl-5-thioribose-1-phosphate isomerase [Microaceticoccus formicicus]|uniref:S-methyl-5-thioribose-1-phosphate isomerase n=1 Tax=Microaceticoccus formicicus TaxID=3118105 RepID=UPI003CD03E4D|nr:S-methyl-5-thioribose-1-phosphate isomerase [Peptoniphilaceae bacterium AMB_02]
MEKKFEHFDTVDFNFDKNALRIIDQTLLPTKINMLELDDEKSIWDAIHLLKVRGAPAIGVAAAIGIAILSKKIKTEDIDEYKSEFNRIKNYLETSRPTAVNLFWALDRMKVVVDGYGGDNPLELNELLMAEAAEIREEDIKVCKSIGENGLKLLKDGMGILTHCNAGSLATVKYGTATAPMYLAHEAGMKIKVFADETRPLLQGARLTAYELNAAGIDTTLICDNMSQTVMRQGKVDIIFVGCDRVAVNGDACNKIGTSMVALAAKRHNIPFYICAPTSTIDFSIESGEEIVIEERKPEEITEMWYEQRMAPEGINVYNPAFDVTDADLITGIITEYGIIYPPFKEGILKLKEENNL